MTTTTTPNLGIVKAVPGTNEPFSTTVVDSNYDIIDTAVGKRTSRVSTATVASSTTETVVMTHTITAASAVVGMAFKIVAWGQASSTATPTLTLRLRIGGVAGATIGTIAMVLGAISNKNWRAEGELICITTGATGTWLGGIQLVNEFATTLPIAADVNVATTPQTKDTTASQDLVITAQWSVNSASNTISAYAGYACREA